VRAALWLALVLVLTSAGSATAGRRAALVNVAPDGAPAAAELDRLRAQVAARGVAPLPAGPLRTALEGPVDRRSSLAAARAFLVDAEQAAARFAPDEAAALVARAEAAALDDDAAGEPDIATALADVVLRRASLAADAGDEGKALGELRLLRRLDPGRRLDPAVHRPRLIELFARAEPTEASAELRISSDPPGAVVWLDGRQLGSTPQAIAPAPGPHLLALVAPGRRPHRERIALSPGATSERSIALGRTAPERSAAIAHLRLAQEGSAPAAGALAALLGVDALVLVRPRAGGVEVAVYDHRRGRLGRFRPASASDALAGLAPADDRLFAARPPPPPRRAGTRWYRTWWGISLLAVGAGSLATGAYFLASDRSPESYRVSRWCLDDSCQ
jgi:hypothetical protein